MTRGCAPHAFTHSTRTTRRGYALLTALYVLATASAAFGQGSIMLVGGGAESYGGWSDAPYAWFVQQADSGIIVNIDVGSASSWYPSYFISLGADPASHGLQIPTRALANSQATYNDLVAARGIFIEGGDQWDFVATWKGTLVEDAIHEVFASGGVIGGTSAGCAILGEVVYDARYGSVYPEEAAYDPYDSHISFTDDFLHILPDVITDSHFHARGRMGRLVPFLARRIQDYGDSTLAGIGVEEYTAFCIAPDSVARVFGDEVCIVRPVPGATLVCERGRPVTFSPVQVDQLIHGAFYDLATRTLLHPGTFLNPVTALPPPPEFADVFLDGSLESTGLLGEISITGMTSDDDAWWLGSLGWVPGHNLVPRTVVVPRLWSAPAFFANRWIGGMYGTATHPGFLALWLDVGCTATVASSGMLRSDRLTYVLETARATWAGTTSNRIPGFIGARLHALGPADELDLGALQAPSRPSRLRAPLRVSPSPVTNLATIRFDAVEPGHGELQVWDHAGRLVARHPVLVSRGPNELRWRPAVPSGSYVVALERGDTRISCRVTVIR